MAGRRKGRILAFQALYANDVAGTEVSDLLRFDWIDADKKETLDEELLTFTRLLVSGSLENKIAIDKAIKTNVKNWDFERISKVDLAILRLGAYTLLFQKDVPPSVVIDEAVEIAKEYSADDSFKFVNGVLDGIRRSL